MNDYNKKYFLACNSCEGFVSHFSNLFNPDEAWKAFLIKGGPGTGKSSFMKYCARFGEKNNIDFEIFPCSSDPNSLDGISFPDKKICILDATAPHQLDPLYPAVCEQILNFGEFWDSTLLNKNRENILSLTKSNKLLHKKASSYLLACGQLILDSYKTALACTDEKKTIDFAKAKARKHITKSTGNPSEEIRFLQGVSPFGIISYNNTITENYKNIVIISDEFYSASNIIMNYIREYALLKSHRIITIKNPFLPSHIIDHILIPELSLAFVTESQYMHFNTNERRIHSRRFVSNTLIHNSRSRIQFNKKISKILLKSACATLSRAKTVHDELETYYIQAMNFNSVIDFANKFLQENFKNALS